MKRLGLSSLFLLVTPIFVCAAPAAAHLDLTDPPPRLGGEAGGSQLKRGPCGQNTNGRTSTVTVYEPGETITVTWDEYINHPSYYRIAFDVDGDDDFPIRANMDTVVRAGDDPAVANPIGDVVLLYLTESPDRATYSAEVTLPNVECENCTLQVIQFMYDKLGDGRDNEYYFQCADIALRRGAGSDGGTSPVDGGASPVDGGSRPVGTDGGVVAGSDGGTTPPGDGGGCGVAAGADSRPALGVFLALVALGLIHRRRGAS